MKINQYCSVCKKHLDMEVIPTDDGGDDGVIWLRCPECQGFLPKFTGEGMKQAASAARRPARMSRRTQPTGPRRLPQPIPRRSRPAAPVAGRGSGDDARNRRPVDVQAAESTTLRPNLSSPSPSTRPSWPRSITENARPYRPNQTYAVGDVVLHLAYDDVGIVVAKERLPGGRKAVKVFFDGAGVVHLIEQASDSH